MNQDFLKQILRAILEGMNSELDTETFTCERNGVKTNIKAFFTEGG